MVATVRAPEPAKPSQAVVEAEEVSLDCVGAEDRILCSAQGAYRYRNPSHTTEQLDLDVSNTSARELRVSVDGRPATSDLIKGSSRLSMSLGPGATREVATRVEVDALQESYLFTWAPLRVRHWLLGEDPSQSVVSMMVCPSKKARWAGVGPHRIRLRGPSRWDFEEDGWQPDPSEGDSVFGRESTSGECETLRWRHRSREIPIYHGGPFVGLGHTFDEGFRMRFGYEAGVESWALASLSGETDMDGQWIVTPLFEAATPMFLFIPSVGAGVGVPVRVRPDARAGVRGQLSLTWGLGGVLTFDYWPSDRELQVTLMGQVGF